MLSDINERSAASVRTFIIVIVLIAKWRTHRFVYRNKYNYYIVQSKIHSALIV